LKLRTRVTKGAGSKKAALAVAYKLLDAAQERWRGFNGHELITDDRREDLRLAILHHPSTTLKSAPPGVSRDVRREGTLVLATQGQG